MPFEIKDVDLAGRIGLLKTRHGIIETPAFFPVIDIARQDLPPSEIMKAGFNQVITNAYLTLKRYGEKAVEKGIHGLLGFEGVVMTDSGAYQILEYGRINLDPIDIIEYQKAIGSDIGVILDIPTGDVDRARAEYSVEETLKRAEAAQSHLDDKTLWVLPIQGGRYFDLVEKSASRSRDLQGYSIYGIGSPTVYLEKYRYDIVVGQIIHAKKHIKWSKPVHLFGAGHPLIIPLAVALGVDMFDSASYILYARTDRYMTDYGVEDLSQLEYFPCNCPVCTRYTPQELREMPKPERTRLLALHNLYAIRRAIDRTKQAIKAGLLWELVEETARKHPNAFAAFTRIRRAALQMLEETTPRSKGIVRGIRLYSIESTFNPRVLRWRETVASLNLESGFNTLIVEPLGEKCRKPDSPDTYLLFMKPLLGVVPWELCGMYPSMQSHTPPEPPIEAARDLAREVTAFIRKARNSGVKRVIVRIPDSQWWRLTASYISNEIDVELTLIE